jgi:hypothetical protein
MNTKAGMRILLIIISLNLISVAAIAQNTDSINIAHPVDSTLKDTIHIPKGETPEVLIAAPGHNIYGDLLNDDPAYNKRSSVGITALRVTSTNVFNWAIDRYIFNFDWARISTETWKHNLKSGFVWDDDRFGINFIGHPHSGNYYFNIARSNGYSFWTSFPFAVGGSLMWELFGENTEASRNDIINTPISGAFLGEILYRLSSNILDDRTRGRERFFRELIAGLLNPPRGLNRLTQGKMFRVTPGEVYQKEPLNIIFEAGVHKVNAANKFGTGTTNAILNLQLDYGDPFEVRHRKPFDLFRFRMESRYGNDKKLIDNVLGYGFLLGGNISNDNYGMLAGIFQHFDYWNNKIFELGSIGFGPGIIGRFNLGNTSHLYSSLHIAAVPLAGNSTRIEPDTSAYRDYPFSGGVEGRIEETFNLGHWMSLGFTGYYYWLNSYEPPARKSRIGIIKPRITVRLAGNVYVGFEHHIYYDNQSIEKTPSLHIRQTEQKFFIQILLEDKRRIGKYH